MPQATTVEVGDSIREWREAAGLTQDEVATAARAYGLDWTRDTVAAIEYGRRELAVGELVLLRSAPISRKEVAPLFAAPHGRRRLSADSAAKQDAELKAARKLRVSPDAIVGAARQAWGRTLTEERDRLLGENLRMDDSARAYWAARGNVYSPRDARTLRAVRGHITRALVVELQQALTGRQRR